MNTIKTGHHSERTYEFRVYVFVSAYMEETELLTTFTKKFRNGFWHKAQKEAEEWARLIGAHGLTVENPKGHFTFYPADRIAKVEFTEV